MEAETAATYTASSVRFSFFIDIFILEHFRIAVATSKSLITFTPFSRSTTKIKKLLHFYNYFDIKKFLETLEKSCSLCSLYNALKLYAVTSQLVFLHSLL